MISSLDQRKPNPTRASLPRFDRSGRKRMILGSSEKSAEMRRKLIETDLVDTALCDSTFTQRGAIPQVVSAAKDNFRKDDDVRWQPSGARQIAKGNPQGERGGVHQFGVPPKGNANFAWVQHFIHHLAPQGSIALLFLN